MGSNIIKSIAEYIEQSIGEDYRVECDYASWDEGKTKTVRPDISVFTKQDNACVAVVEVKRYWSLADSESEKKRRQQSLRHLHSLLDSTDALFGALTDGEQCVIVKPVFGKERVTYCYHDIKGLIQELQQYKNYRLEQPKKEELLGQMIRQLTSSTLPAKDFLTEILKTVPDQVNFENNNFFLSPELEMKLIENLLGMVEPSVSLYRYVSIESLFRMINDGTDSMCGLAVMNDKSECYFIDEMVAHQKNTKLSDMSVAEIEELNKFFINSLTEVNPLDDLTMWRLYGKDGSGVCLEYEIDDNLLKKSGAFFLMKVDYSGSMSRKSKAVKLLSNLQRARRVLGFKFVFKQMNIWKHFFKPEQFAVEKEIRLLFVNPRDAKQCTEKWIYNSDYGIIHPIVIFDKKKNHSYPLNLKKITLGPKFKEADTNMAQIKYLLHKNGMQVDLEKSAIEFYR